MKCTRCQQENPPQAKFCLECGTALALKCRVCGTELPIGAKFCFECGQSLSAQLAIGSRFASPEVYTPKHLAEKILTSKSALEGERKQVTVLFADMKGSMELLADRDPEEARKLLDPVLEHMMEAVHQYEGTVNQVMGDGIMALFGAPLAHEDHAVRACYSALRMQEAVKKYAEGIQRAEGIPIQIRVGVNSGEVVVRSIGSDLKMDYTAVGQTTHLAARMEQIAMPGSVMMTADTLSLTEGFVQVKPLGPVNVKGLNEPVEVYEITGAGPVRSRLQAAAARGLTRFVGRTAEFETLCQALERAGASHGQVVALVGEPGVGKSRLFWEFTHSRRTVDWLILESGSVSYGKATAYLPVIDLLKVYFSIEDQDDVRKIREKVTGKLLTLDKSLESTLPAFLTLLDIAVEDEQWGSADPPQRRQRTLDAVKRLLIRESQVQPLLLVFEDLHWIDSESQSVLDSLVESVPSAHILLLVNYRPEYRHNWGSRTYYSQLRIDPLPPESAGELLETLLGKDLDLAPLKQLLIERTEGNPFFLEESIRTLVETRALQGERGSYRLSGVHEIAQMPATVQAVVVARIDRLPLEEKRLLQSAAVIGKNVPFMLLQAIADQSEEELRRGLARLQAAEFLYETSLFPDLEYTFKHALTHEVAYGSVLQERRRGLHAHIVESIERLYPERLTEQVELLAHHASRAELWEEAVEYLHQAGKKAAARSATREAIARFEQALEVLRHLPDNNETIEEAINIRVDLAPALMATKGHGAPEVEETYNKARELCQRLGEMPQLFPILWGLSRVYNSRGELQASLDLSEQLLSTAQRLKDPALLLEAHHTLWTILFTLGELDAAQKHAEYGVANYNQQEHSHLASLYGGHDPGVCGLRHAAMTLWLLGYPDQALKRSQEAVALAQNLSHPYSLAQALYVLGRVHQQRGELETASTWIDAITQIGTERGFLRYVMHANFLRGRLMVDQGRTEEGIVEMRRAVGARLESGHERSYYIASIGEALGRGGQIAAALSTLTDEIARAAQAGKSFYEAELYRVKGDLLLKLSPPDEVQAEGCFLKALEVACRQQAKSLELRATMSLSRLGQRQGKKEEARNLLAGIYGWFTEGFNTADLKAAKALLEELS
jgi:class 3 adenylate cyclase/predicted ATPase/ribosomal protein L40E